MQNSSERRTLRDSVVVALVSVYLIGVGTFLILTRRIVTPSFLRIFRGLAHRPYTGPVRGIETETGQCYIAALPGYLISDMGSRSSLHLFENDRELGPAHAPHDEIRSTGAGRFAHWGPRLYFSTSDNTDPRTNGRSYRVQEIRGSLFPLRHD